MFITKGARKVKMFVNKLIELRFVTLLLCIFGIFLFDDLCKLHL